MLVFARETGDPDVLVVAASARARLALVRKELPLARHWLESATDDLGATPLFLWIESPVLTLIRVSTSSMRAPTMRDKHKGFLWGVWLAGTLPAATGADLAGKQWRAGPELFGRIFQTERRQIRA